MGLKKYIVASIVFIAVVAGYVFSIQKTDFQIMLFEKTFTLPVALWVILPLVVLFLASILHMVFYGLKHYIETMGVAKDKENMIKCLKNSLLKKDETIKFKNSLFKDIAEFLSQVNVEIKTETFNSNNKEIRELAKAIVDINHGKYTSLSVKLDATNALAKKNSINKINEQIDFALDVLKRPSNHSFEEIEAAFYKVLEGKSMTSIKKILPNIKMNKEMLMELFKRDSVQTEFSLDKDELLKEIKSAEFTSNEFIQIAKMYKSSLIPDEIIEIFEELSNHNELAQEAYMYVLFEFEMIDKIRDIFSSSSKEEYSAFRALLDLKDSGKNYTLDSISYLK
ncbi:MAG: hypothetical protein ACNI3C_01310 [Candidatus Marinarcus sp.]|uniref:hypothetical protein n=1 Tax=Candidatus Marinarcus sp. TaxID=3100987 RepID=UPI003B009D13